MRYPVTSSGLAVPVQELGFEVVPHVRKETNRHHLQFSRSNYVNDPVRRIFRGLADRVVELNMEDHHNLHERYCAPKMPSEVAMIDCVEEYLSVHGVIDVVYESRTQQTYQVDADRWNLIIGRAVA